MIDIDIQKIGKDIRNLKIQGASKIESEAIKAIIDYVSKNKENLSEEKLKENIKYLSTQRPNEPKLRNSLNFLLKKYYENKNNIDEYIKKIKYYEMDKIVDNDKIAEIASELITNGTKILTHCHSNIVEKCFKKAFDKNKDFEVFCTETRPRYQGRITAKRLCEYGIETTQIVDSSVAQYLKKIDFFITGADVVFFDGSIMNKVGTHTISLIAKKFQTPHIVLTSTNTCESNNVFSLIEDIEERNDEEVWEKEERPKNLKIRNPAFDIVPSNLIDKFITEEGVFTPETLSFWVNKINYKNKII